MIYLIKIIDILDVPSRHGLHTHSWAESDGDMSSKIYSIASLTGDSIWAGDTQIGLHRHC